MLYSIPEEDEGATVEVEQHAHTVTLFEGTSRVVSLFAIAVKSASIGANEPAISA
jgi:hypothetical protein